MNPGQVTEIALVNASGAQDPADFAFAAEACRLQLVEHFLPAWAGYLPDEMPMTVVGYSSTRDLKPGSFWGIEVLASLDDPGVLGDHGDLNAICSTGGATCAVYTRAAGQTAWRFRGSANMWGLTYQPLTSYAGTYITALDGAGISALGCASINFTLGA